MPRMNGERWEEFQARRAHAIEAAIATKAKELEYELKVRNGVALPVVQVDQPCTCEHRPFAHFHADDDQHRALSRFRRRFAPLFGSDGQEIRAHGNVAYFGGDRGQL